MSQVEKNSRRARTATVLFVLVMFAAPVAIAVSNTVARLVAVAVICLGVAGVAVLVQRTKRDRRRAAAEGPEGPEGAGA
ncbi:hypothetical protein [Streptomyces phytophilus]|uniref:hypothetical protein n=1 Tax=Streptomyces phytophilus TaxID=722715 RepID=UPI0015F021B1|nr:hypothetical protein [Streptomyces phytophilus]